MPKLSKKNSQGIHSEPVQYLKSHLGLIEKSLVCLSDTAASFGHPVHKGSARENFVRDFIVGHIGEDLGVSSGEIFDSERSVGDKANQIDVIIYRKNFPKIRMITDDINAFMAESVLSAIEVKSQLQKAEVKATYNVAHAIRSLKNGMTSDSTRPIRCYLVAFKTQAKIRKVADWLVKSQKDFNTTEITHAIDGVFVLGKGYVVSPMLASMMKENHNEPKPSSKWTIVEQETGNLYALFFAINFLHYGIDIRHYFKDLLPDNFIQI